MSADPTAFAIVGTQRTGTTLIQSSLDSHPDIRSLGEVFKIRTPTGRFYTGELGYPAYRKQSRKTRIGHYLWRGAQTRQYLDQLYAMTDVTANGFKFMRTHIIKFPMVVAYLKKREARIVHVVRRNVLKTLVSLETAKIRGLYHSEKPVEQIRIELPIDQLIGRLNRIEGDNRYWQKVFADYPAYQRVVYEDYVADQEQHSEALQSFLGVPYKSLTTRLRKVNTNELADIVQNFAAVEKRLRSSTFEFCLEA